MQKKLSALSPLIKWPGGKRRLLTEILPLVPERFGRYYEPFLGSGALFFALEPKAAFLSDKNLELVCMYSAIKKSPNSVISALRRLRNNEETYYRVRSSNPTSRHSRAARMLYLSELSFNGIHRVNLRGEFNVPYGKKTHLRPCRPEKILGVSAALRVAKLRCQDFEAALRHAKKGDFIYLDPPYTTAHNNNGFVRYNAKIFTWADQERLAETAQILARRGCSVMVSNADHGSIRSLYRGFSVRVIQRVSIMSASTQFRRRISECIFLNY